MRVQQGQRGLRVDLHHVLVELHAVLGVAVDDREVLVGIETFHLVTLRVRELETGGPGSFERCPIRAQPLFPRRWIAPECPVTWPS